MELRPAVTQSRNRQGPLYRNSTSHEPSANYGRQLPCELPGTASTGCKCSATCRLQVSDLLQLRRKQVVVRQQIVDFHRGGPAEIGCIQRKTTVLVKRQLTIAQHSQHDRRVSEQTLSCQALQLPKLSFRSLNTADPEHCLHCRLSLLHHECSVVVPKGVRFSLKGIVDQWIVLVSLTDRQALQGLRLHDNPALLDALTECKQLYPVFVFDPWFAGNGK